VNPLVALSKLARRSEHPDHASLFFKGMFSYRSKSLACRLQDTANTGALDRQRPDLSAHAASYRSDLPGYCGPMDFHALPR